VTWASRLLDMFSEVRILHGASFFLFGNVPRNTEFFVIMKSPFARWTYKHFLYKLTLK
jgi:hypothetical protein